MEQCIDEEIPDILDQNYVTQFEADKGETEIMTINLYCLYINNDELYNIRCEKLELDNNCLSKEILLFLIKKNQTNGLFKHRLVSLLKYEIDLEYSDVKNLINNELNTNFLSSLKLLDSLNFNNRIPLLNDLNCIFLIFGRNLTPNNIINKNNTTKRIVIKSTSKTKRKRT